MYDYLQTGYFNQEQASHEYRVAVAEEFLDRYTRIRPQDVYRWLWEGEFGPGINSPDLTLDRLTEDLRNSRMRPRSSVEDIWEPMGLSMRILKINLVPYADAGCPMLRLLEMAEHAREVRPNTMRFKKDWYFVKTQITPDLSITIEQMTAFENTIAFHMTPEVTYSPDYLEAYGLGYRLAPRQFFFKFFPEYEPEDEQDITRAYFDLDEE